MSQFLDCHRVQAYLNDLAEAAHPNSCRPCAGLNTLNLELHEFETLNSTNRTAWEYFQQGAGEGTVIIAAQQRAGRGQWGRQWQSDRGGVYLSFILCPNLKIQDAPYLTLTSAWGIAHSLRQQGIPVQLKWPNDLVLTGHKLGGILTETRVAHGQLESAVVGVGVNGWNAVPDPGINLQTYLAEASPQLLQGSWLNQIYHPEQLIPLEAIVALILQGLSQGYWRLQQDNRAGLIADYESLLLNRGQLITIEGQVKQVLGITEQGYLRVQTQLENGTGPIQVIKPGEIQLGYSNQRYPDHAPQL